MDSPSRFLDFRTGIIDFVSISHDNFVMMGGFNAQKLGSVMKEFVEVNKLYKLNYSTRYVAKFNFCLFWFSNLSFSSKFIFTFKISIIPIQLNSFCSITLYLFNYSVFIQYYCILSVTLYFSINSTFTQYFYVNSTIFYLIQ